MKTIATSFLVCFLEISPTHRTAQKITFALRLLSLARSRDKSHIPCTPIRDMLINELKVLKYRSQRITGSFRFDMAVVGNPEPGNAPKLLEINEIGFDGLARSSFIQETILSLAPELRKNLVAFDTASAETRNMRRLENHWLAFNMGITTGKKKFWFAKPKKA